MPLGFFSPGHQGGRKCLACQNLALATGGDMERDVHSMVNPQESIVLVVDDDPRVRAALSSLLRSVRFQVSMFESAAEFLQASPPDAPTCLILDLQLPDINGLELQQKLAETHGPPIIFISGHGDIPSS